MLLGRAARSLILKILLFIVTVLGTHLLLFDRPRYQDINLDELQMLNLDLEIELAKHVRLVTYQPPDADDIAEEPQPAKDATHKEENKPELTHRILPRTLKYHKIWSFADASINIHELFPDTPDVDVILNAMRTAQIVAVDAFDMDEEGSGTSEKWLVHLEGGQKAVMKLEWETKGKAKPDGMCNYGYEMVHGEIAAFHLHKLLGMRNTPYVTGRRVDLRQEIYPVASPAVAKQINIGLNNQTCVTGQCYHCSQPRTLCPPGGVADASLAYWVPRKLKLYTHRPHFMPWSTPRDEQWKNIGFNNKSYCEVVRGIHPYEIDRYYHDLFDFAAVDALMYHYDSKHYIVYDGTDAHGLTVRLDHGRAFCAHDSDEMDIFMAPLTQCCMIRWATYDALSSMRGGILAKKLREELARDPLFPVLEEEFYVAINRRVENLVRLLEQCAEHNGGLDNILVG